MKAPDFWLVECDTFWHELGVDRVACYIVEGPDSFLDGVEMKFWLVRTEPSVEDHGRETNLVLVSDRVPGRVDAVKWTRSCIRVVSIDPVTRVWLEGHKMTATTNPDRRA
jgi:hypothetical protein